MSRFLFFFGDNINIFDAWNSELKDVMHKI